MLFLQFGRDLDRIKLGTKSFLRFRFDQGKKTNSRVFHFSALQAVAVPLLGKGLHYSFVNIDIFNIAGWIGIVATVFKIFITLFWFKEHNIDVKDSTGNISYPFPFHIMQYNIFSYSQIYKVGKNTSMA